MTVADRPLGCRSRGCSRLIDMLVIFLDNVNELGVVVAVFVVVVDVVVVVIVVGFDAKFASLRCKRYFHDLLSVILAFSLTRIYDPPF